MIDVDKFIKENRVLTKKQVLEVHNNALRILEETGSRIECKEALDILKKIGCDISDNNRVKIPHGLVEKALESCPSEISIYNRDAELAMRLKRGACYYGTGSDCNTIVDLNTGERRLCLGKDVENLAKFSDSLQNIDFVMSFGIANDAPKGKNFVYQFKNMLCNTSKPIIVTGHGRNDMETIVQMASVAVGGEKYVREKPPLILYTEPLSPLVHTEMGLGKGLVCCEYGVPFIYIGSPMMGATSPATREGTFAQSVAEGLAGIVIFQNKEPGAKIIFGCDASVFDMKDSIFSYGAPELNFFNNCMADMAHYYDIPFFCIAGASDAKELNAQAGAEYGISILNATLNGCNIIHDCGYLESGLTSSYQSLLFADEIISSIKKMFLPLDFNKKNTGLESIHKIGPGGNFLLDDVTVNNYKTNFYFPRDFNRERYDIWKEFGAKTLVDTLTARARNIMSDYTNENLSNRAVDTINEILSRHQGDI